MCVCRVCVCVSCVVRMDLCVCVCVVVHCEEGESECVGAWCANVELLKQQSVFGTVHGLTGTTYVGVCVCV